MASSTLSPKVHKKKRFPTKCMRLPCINKLVMSVESHQKNFNDMTFSNVPYYDMLKY